MRTRCCAVVIAILGCLAAPAHADPRAEIAAKARAAMASYDAMDYAAARRQLYQALEIAKKSRLDKDPIVARVYLDLGITQLAGSDPEAAKVAFLSAVQIDPKIAVDPGYKSAELVRMLDEARAAASDEPAGDDCRSVHGLQLTAIDGARRGVAQPIEALIGGDLSPARVVVMYRPEGAIDFTEARLARQGGCRYAGTIPAAAMHGALLHYYVAAYDANNKVLAAKGSSGAPGILALGGRAPAHDAEDPVGAARPPANPEHAEPPGVVAHVSPGVRGSRIVLAVSAGTGLGYVSGKTEGDNLVQKCCFGTSPVVISPELSYRWSPRTSIGAVARIGLPLGANIAGHSTIAPAGFLRLSHAFADSGDGIHVMAELGFGILRDVIQVGSTMPGMDTDVVAQGPLLVGAGAGYTRHLGGAFAVLVDLDVIGALAVVDKLGTAIHLHTSVGGDLRLGLAVGF